MPPAAQTALTNIAKVHPQPGAPDQSTGRAGRYVEEEDDSALMAKKTIKATAAGALGDEDKPLFVPETTVIDPRCIHPAICSN